MANSFSGNITFDKQQALAVIVPSLRKDGMYYEVNISNYPRFFMKWSELGRYDITDRDVRIPYNLLLAVSDLIEKRHPGRR